MMISNLLPFRAPTERERGDAVDARLGHVHPQRVQPSRPDADRRRPAPAPRRGSLDGDRRERLRLRARVEVLPGDSLVPPQLRAAPDVPQRDRLGAIDPRTLWIAHVAADVHRDERLARVHADPTPRVKTRGRRGVIRNHRTAR
eukprot:31158-Pelagococcus_subviridis.AAC.10